MRGYNVHNTAVMPPPLEKNDLIDFTYLNSMASALRQKPQTPLVQVTSVNHDRPSEQQYLGLSRINTTLGLS
jgi:hypothetical protein